ncbi:DMT family transporter [Limobrevibacterium gyesilva]|uniref:DMT family transporter n=1 Tax=Limobrevibacterium gyesilva TaxID=2991712 RepID=A0AA42CFD3_9PROT|nr:DMT family transporter [Limobrevibacterium gyesilva]MCW3476464.1 DMT family transporter [Limobrevibacterium gyesilva]
MLVLLLGIVWGLNWPAARLSLLDLSPWTFRTLGLGLGALALIGIACLRGHSLTIPPGRPRLHLALSGLLNMAGFNLMSAFAQLGTTTSRVAIIAYTMPLWATLMARFALGDRLDATRTAALLLGATGLLVLVVPFIGTHVPVGMYFALGAAVSWAAGTVYVKWARIPGHALAIAAWQLLVGAAAAAIGVAVFEGTPHLWPLRPAAAGGLLYNVLIGSALAYFLWFEIVSRLPVATASLGILMVPVVGVVSATLLLGERPTGMDIAGFALVLSAAACVLLLPGRSGSRARLAAGRTEPS